MHYFVKRVLVSQPEHVRKFAQGIRLIVVDSVCVLEVFSDPDLMHKVVQHKQEAMQYHATLGDVE